MVLRKIADQAWFSYLTIFLLQAKVLWGIWEYKDLTFGDTSSYFRDACQWFWHYKDNIAYSPLYTVFYGTLLHVSMDPYAVTILHRIIIVFAITLLLLAVMRRLLPHAVAWAVSAWWAILPIHFDSLYEVHLFAVIAPLVACLLAAYKPTAWARGGSLAIIACSTFLVRNELVVATAVLALACILWEMRVVRITKSEKQKNPPLRYYLFSYGLPLVLAAFVISFFYWRAAVKFPQLKDILDEKHSVNMCQVYAFGYQQRHPDWARNPWLQCQELMRQHFGSPTPSLYEMFRRNPKAVLENLLWNIRLAPNGLQVLLLNATSGSANPDYAPVNKSNVTLLFSFFILIILAYGIILLYRDRSVWWSCWFEPRFMAWITLISLSAVAPFVILSSRPRPSYLFTTGIFLMACVGMCSHIIFHRSALWKRLSPIMPMVMIASFILIPSYYPNVNKAKTRPLLELQRRMEPFKETINNPDVVFMVNGFPFELTSYLEAIKTKRFVWYQLVDQTPSSRPALTDFIEAGEYSLLQIPKNQDNVDIPLYKLLDKMGVNMIYVDHNLWALLDKQKMNKAFVRMPESVGWKIIGYQNSGSNKWMLLQKK